MVFGSQMGNGGWDRRGRTGPPGRTVGRWPGPERQLRFYQKWLLEEVDIIIKFVYTHEAECRFHRWIISYKRLSIWYTVQNHLPYDFKIRMTRSAKNVTWRKKQPYWKFDIVSSCENPAGRWCQRDHIADVTSSFLSCGPVSLVQKNPSWINII